MSADDTIGTDYVYECEAMTGWIPAPWTGEKVRLASCPNPATKQPDGSYLCSTHAPVTEAVAAIIEEAT